MAATVARSKAIADILEAGLRAVQRGPASIAPPCHAIDGISPRGVTCMGRTLGEIQAEFDRTLIESGRIYRNGDTLCLQVEVGDELRLVPLAISLKAEPNAPALLSNVVIGRLQTEDSSQEFVIPHNLIAALLARQPLWSRAPAIKHVTRRPAFDLDFILCKRGWNSAPGVLSLGADIDPAVVLPPVDASGGPLARLPKHLGALLGEFHWAGDPDLISAVAALLTGLLVNHVVDKPHPPFLIEGNQRGVGKTLMVQAFGRVLDAIEPSRIALGGDEELGKRLCAELLCGASSILFNDNIRGRIASELLEQNMLSPVVTFRVLGHSRTISRANTYLWITTSNQTTATEDVMDRYVVIRLQFEGDPRVCRFARDPLEYAAQHRQEILGELTAMVQRWVACGRPLGQQVHRCQFWAKLIGGILNANGLGDLFLASQAEAVARLDEGIQALTALAEHVLGSSQAEYFGIRDEDTSKKGRPASDWVRWFEACQLHRDVLANKSPHAKSTWVGTYLGAKTDRTVKIENDQYATATLRRREGRSNQKLYWLELRSRDVIETSPAALTAQPPTQAENAPQVDTVVATRTVRPTSDDQASASVSLCAAPITEAGDAIVSHVRGNDLDWR